MTLHPFEEHTPVIHEGVFAAPGVRIVGDVTLGDGVNVWFNAVIRGDMAPVSIGPHTNIQDGCVLHVDHDYPLTVGASVTVGHQAILHGCTIKDGALVGMGARVLNGAVVGEGALVGAGALVPEAKVIPPHSLAIGIPARVVRKLTDEESQKLEQSAVYYSQKADRYKTSGVNTLD